MNKCYDQSNDTVGKIKVNVFYTDKKSNSRTAIVVADFVEGNLVFTVPSGISGPMSFNLVCPNCGKVLIGKGYTSVSENSRISWSIDHHIVWDPHDQQKGYISCTACKSHIEVRE